MIKIKQVLSELRGALGGYGFAQPQRQVEDDTSLQDTAAFHKEMKDHLISRFKGLVDTGSLEDDAEAAIYWFANDYHGGQSDPLYAVLSQSKYPDSERWNKFTNSVEAEDELVNELYKELKKAFGKDKVQEATMSSGRYIGQVLGNVIGDIEKGRVPDALDLLKKLKADLEKAGTEVVEDVSSSEEKVLDALTNVLLGFPQCQDAIIETGLRYYGFFPSQVLDYPESAKKIRAQLQGMLDDATNHEAKIIKKMLSVVPEVEA